MHSFASHWLERSSRSIRPILLDELIKRRARSGVGIADTQRHALLGVIDAMLLARCDVLVGKFSSGLFRAAYSLAAGCLSMLRSHAK